MVCKWNRSGAGLFHASVAGYDGGQYHLIVERVPGQRKDRAWDWAMWRAEWSEAIGQHGHSRSARGAMEAAERAAEVEFSSRAMSAGARSFASQTFHLAAKSFGCRASRSVKAEQLGETAAICSSVVAVRRRSQRPHEAMPSSRQCGRS